MGRMADLDLELREFFADGLTAAAAAEAAVWKLNLVALFDALKLPSYIAFIAAATKIASVPAASSGA